MAELSRDWVVVKVPVVVETTSGLRIGGEREASVAGTDLPLLRLPDGRPYVPGSSVKGVLRSVAERLLAAKGMKVCEVLNEQLRCGGPGGRDARVKYDDLCWTCRLFGSPHWAGRVWCGDFAPEASVVTVVRDGVVIDRDELKAASHYDYEVIPPGAVLRGEVRIDDPEPGDVGLVLVLWDMVHDGLVTFGSGASRGLGRLRLRERPTARRLSASTWSPGAAFEDIDRALLDAELNHRLAQTGKEPEEVHQRGER